MLRSLLVTRTELGEEVDLLDLGAGISAAACTLTRGKESPDCFSSACRSILLDQSGSLGKTSYRNSL